MKAKHKPLTKAQHRRRHILLHRHFDELLADFLAHHKRRLPSNISALDLMAWSHRQTIEPEEFLIDQIEDLKKRTQA